MKEVRIGLIGTGYIGKAHAIAYAQAPTVFNLRGRLVREMVAEVTPELAAARAQAFGFNRSTGDWRALVADPAIDVVDICSPNHLHKEMALEAIRHGKHVYSEKPLALNAHDAREMVDAAKRAGVKTLVGFNYMKNPTAQLAKEIIARGEIGEVIHFYGTHNEDYMADPLSPIHWHCFKETAGLGALGDLAAHIVNMAQYLVGDIEQVCGDLKIVVPARPAKAGSAAPANINICRALLPPRWWRVSVVDVAADDLVDHIEPESACGEKAHLLGPSVDVDRRYAEFPLPDGARACFLAVGDFFDSLGDRFLGYAFLAQLLFQPCRAVTRAALVGPLLGKALVR